MSEDATEQAAQPDDRLASRGPSPATGPAASSDQQAPQEGVRPDVRTGVPAVDAVLDRLDAVAEQPVEEHPALLEQAHTRLREVLDGDGDEYPAVGDADRGQQDGPGSSGPG